MHNAHVHVRAMCEGVKGAMHVHGCIELFFRMWRKSSKSTTTHTITVIDDKRNRKFGKGFKVIFNSRNAM